MRHLVSLLALVLLASHTSHPQERGLWDTTSVASTVCITSEFAVEIDYPNFVISILAHLTGAHIERLKLEEWDQKTPALNSFLYHLSEGEDRWLELASDSAFPSFVTLPREDRTVISPGALNFVKGLVQLFQSPRTDTLRGVFEYAGDTLGGRAFQQHPAIDSGSRVTTFSRVETWNRNTGEEYISGDVQAVTHDGYMTYQEIRISLKHKNVKMRFTPLSVGIARSGHRQMPAGESVQVLYPRPD
jgi:hypothetical protein